MPVHLEICPYLPYLPCSREKKKRTHGKQMKYAIFTPFKEQNCLDMEENKRTRNYEVSQITLDPNSLLKIVIQTPLRK